MDPHLPYYFAVLCQVRGCASPTYDPGRCSGRIDNRTESIPDPADYTMTTESSSRTDDEDRGLFPDGLVGALT